MGNRKQPFGYQMKLGEVVILPQEAEVVTFIFKQYIAGRSFDQLVDELRKQPISYHADKQWNKNMVARILEDRRYSGEKGFSAIIPKDVLESAVSLRTAKQRPCRQTEAQKAVRQLGGHRATPRIEQEVRDLLNGLINRPDRITTPQPVCKEADILRSELEQALAQMPVDEEVARSLVFRTATARYEAIGPGEYETHRLRRIISQAAPMKELNAKLLRSTVSAILVDGQGSVSIRLKNQQIIERSDENDSDNPEGNHHPGQS